METPFSAFNASAPPAPASAALMTLAGPSWTAANWTSAVLASNAADTPKRCRMVFPLFVSCRKSMVRTHARRQRAQCGRHMGSQTRGTRGMVEEWRNAAAFVAPGRKLHGGCAVHHSKQRYTANNDVESVLRGRRTSKERQR